MVAQQNGVFPDNFRCDTVLIQTGNDVRVIINGGEIPVSNFNMYSDPGQYTELRLTVIPTTIDMITADSVIQNIDWM